MKREEELDIIKKSRILMLSHDISEHEVCKRLYISETGLRNIYHKYYGMPPKQYMLKIYMAKAQTLLRTSDLPIGQIANKLNYQSASKFSITFKKHFGVSPHEYRENIR